MHKTQYLVISKKYNKRYDHIYHSSNWRPNLVTYRYSQSIEASSDHSAVIGDFTLNIDSWLWAIFFSLSRPSIKNQPGTEWWLEVIMTVSWIPLTFIQRVVISKVLFMIWRSISIILFHWLPILIATIISTILTLYVTAIIQQKFEKNGWVF